MLRAFFLFCIITAFLCTTNAQFYSSGEDPASIIWKKIDTKHYRIVFPREMQSDANQLACKLEGYFSDASSDLHPFEKKKRFPVLLNGTSLRSNGFVTLAPERMELIAAPPQDSYAQRWLDQLALHESRHMFQLHTLNQGFTGFMSLFSGQIAPGIVSSQVPTWFYEGDAVNTETVFSTTGRGRLPGFEMEMRAILMNVRKVYAFDKAVFGSYRNFVPDHYRLGYQMVRYTNNHYGSDIWNRALQRTARRPFTIWPFTYALKRTMGFGKVGLYKQTMDSMQKEFNAQHTTKDTFRILFKNKKKEYTSYTRPKSCQGMIFCIRSGPGDAGSLIAIDSVGKIKTLLKTGQSEVFDYDVAGKKLVWTESRNDPRWQKRDYSILLVLDLRTGKRKVLTRKTRFLSPDISPDFKRIAVVEIDSANHQHISVIDIHSGKVVQRISAGSREIQTPEWISSTQIACISITDSGKSLEILDLQNLMWRQVVLPTCYDLSDPIHYHNYIIFRSVVNGIDNIYAVNKQQNNEIYKITNARYGAFFPSVSDDSLHILFSNYSVNGFEIASVPLSKITNLKIPVSVFISSGNPQVHCDSFNIEYKSSSFAKLSHLILIHSWLPVYFNPDDLNNPSDLKITPGFIILSQNLLGSVNLSLGYNYEDGYHRLIPTISWRAWYPVFEFSMTAGGPPMYLTRTSETRLKTQPYIEYNFKAFVPLVFNYGGFIAFFQPRVEYQHFSMWYEKDNELKRGIGFLHLKTNVGHYKRMAMKDLYPKWGQSLMLGYTQTPEEGNIFGSMLSVEASLYFPGILRHHHVNFTGGYQIQSKRMYYIPLNRIDFPRGLHNSVSHEIACLRTSYSFPVAYPDLAAGFLIYLKRIRNTFFYDICSGTDILEATAQGMKHFSGIYRSFGTEVMTDIHFLRIIFPFSAGVRIGYRSDQDKIFTEILVNINTGIF